jgi:phage terminase small subunit
MIRNHNKDFFKMEKNNSEKQNENKSNSGGDLSIALKKERAKTAVLKEQLRKLEQKPVDVDDIDFNQYLSVVDDDLLDRDADEVKKVLAEKLKSMAIVAKKAGIEVAQKEATKRQIETMVSSKVAVFSGSDIAEDVESLILTKISGLDNNASVDDITSVVDSVVDKFKGFVASGDSVGSSEKTSGTITKNPNNTVKFKIELPDKITSFSELAEITERFKKGI